MFPNASGVVINGGTFISPINSTSRGMDTLLEWVATGALHNSDELYDAPKCHPRTRIAVLDDILEWVESESTQEDFILWLFGPAGAGKSAIAKKIAEIAAEKDLLIADFFFSRTSSTRNTKDRLIATLAYQLALSIPDTWSYIEHTIERDPVIFSKTVQTQTDALLIKPLLSISSTQIRVPSQKLIIIDGLDECDDSTTQVAILEVISQSFSQHNLSVKFLIVSRPEVDLVTSFNCNEPLRFVHRRLALDATYRPYDDIRLFFSDKFEHIKRTHRLRSIIPITWPTQEALDMLVNKSSGQFIYASTVVKFVESSRHHPTARLDIILGISPPGKVNPFAELDALYNHLLSDVEDTEITLRVLSFYIMTPGFASTFPYLSMSPELFLSLEPGDIQLALINLSSILTYDEYSGKVEILHASFVDFLSDKHRSTAFYIDVASTCTDFARRILQFVKAPHGSQAGNLKLFFGVIQLWPWPLKGTGQLRSDILNFDLDTFINASIKWKYKKSASGFLIDPFSTWKSFLIDAGLEDRDKAEALDRLNKSWGSRCQIYQSDQRLRLLLTLALVIGGLSLRYYGYRRVPYCRCLDILLGIDDHDLHLADQDALDLRHGGHISWHRLVDTISPSYIDGDACASAALHCLHFLSIPAKYCEWDKYPEKPLFYNEWKATCDITLQMLCKLLQQADISPELTQFINNHDIHPMVQNDFSAHRVWEVNVHILAFLSRASVCSNWRIVSTIQKSLITTHTPAAVHLCTI